MPPKELGKLTKEERASLREKVLADRQAARCRWEWTREADITTFPIVVGDDEYVFQRPGRHGPKAATQDPAQDVLDILEEMDSAN